MWVQENLKQDRVTRSPACSQLKQRGDKPGRVEMAG